MSKVKQAGAAADNQLDSYEQIAAKLKEQQRVLPAHAALGEREQARLKRKQLEDQ
jgi:hypothetical protein